jgi:5'-3' exonuclease
MTGKKNPWEGIVLVPFIDQARLLAACSTINESSLTLLEKERNKLGCAHEMVYPVSS